MKSPLSDSQPNEAAEDVKTQSQFRICQHGLGWRFEGISVLTSGDARSPNVDKVDFVILEKKPRIKQMCSIVLLCYFTQ